MYYLKNIYITRNKIIYVLLTLLASGFSSAVSGGRLTGIEDGKGDSDLACSRGDLLRSSTVTDGERDRDFVLSSLVVSCIGTPSKVVGMEVWPSWDVCGVGGCSVTVGVEGGSGGGISFGCKGAEEGDGGSWVSSTTCLSIVPTL